MEGSNKGVKKRMSDKGKKGIDLGLDEYDGNGR